MKSYKVLAYIYSESKDLQNNNKVITSYLNDDDKNEQNKVFNYIYQLIDKKEESRQQLNNIILDNIGKLVKKNMIFFTNS